MSGNLYLMSDIHGYFIPFLQILKKIRFTDANRMVILGDLVAKGPDSLGLLCFVMEHKNILALRGNHEQRLLQYLEQTARRDPGFHDAALGGRRRGGDHQADEYAV